MRGSLGGCRTCQFLWPHYSPRGLISSYIFAEGLTATSLPSQLPPLPVNFSLMHWPACCLTYRKPSTSPQPPASPGGPPRVWEVGRWEPLLYVSLCLNTFSLSSYQPASGHLGHTCARRGQPTRPHPPWDVNPHTYRLGF